MALAKDQLAAQHRKWAHEPPFLPGLTGDETARYHRLRREIDERKSELAGLQRKIDAATVERRW